MSEWQRCPVCNGTGRVSNWEPIAASNWNPVIQCHRCGGTGTIETPGAFNPAPSAPIKGGDMTYIPATEFIKLPKAIRDNYLEMAAELAVKHGVYKPAPSAPDDVRELKGYRYGEPCSHHGCLNHISHPCEGCGRIAGIRLPTIPEIVCGIRSMIKPPKYELTDAEAAALIQAHVDAKLAALTAKVEQMREALDNLNKWAKKMRSYPAAMQCIGPMTKDRFDGAIYLADAALADTQPQERENPGI